MSLMLAYSAIYSTATAVSMEMNKSIQVKLSGKYTAYEEEVAGQPLGYTEVPIFNPVGGYGHAIIPAVLILVIQQTLLLGIGMSAGTARENNRYRDLVPVSKHYNGIFRIVLGKGLCYFMIYAVLGAYLTMVVPRIFSFVNFSDRFLGRTDSASGINKAIKIVTDLDVCHIYIFVLLFGNDIYKYSFKCCRADLLIAVTERFR